jgi:hypothetical protein
MSEIWSREEVEIIAAACLNGPLNLVCDLEPVQYSGRLA